MAFVDASGCVLALLSFDALARTTTLYMHDVLPKIFILYPFLRSMLETGQVLMGCFPKYTSLWKK